VENFKYLSVVLRNPRVLRAWRHLFLISHMRAYTSLFGHILGDNPEIEGYYEMHIGYYSWKSLIRQRLLYFRDHEAKQGARFMFDKVLHNEHFVSPAILARKDCLAILSLREPEPTIKSIVAQYRQRDPDHEFATLKGACAYYHARVDKLQTIGKAIGGQFLYMDARAIKDNARQHLLELTQHLGLTEPLKPEYRMKPKTGAGNSGDHSEQLKAGVILERSTDYSEIQIDSLVLQRLQEVYTSVRADLMQRAGKLIVI
jgi:hypothetical protein